MYTLSEGRNFISTVVSAVIFLSGICGADIHAQNSEIRTTLEKAQPLFSQDTITLCFMGDMMMHAKQIETGNFQTYFSLIKDRIEEADLAVANMEFTLAGEPYSGYPCFSAPDSYATYLADCGFDVFLAANNHILDKGSEGAKRTADTYRKMQERGVMFTGLAGSEEERKSNYPLIVRKKWLSIAMVNITYGTNLGNTAHWPKTNYMNSRTEVLQALKDSKKADFTIVLPHWGPEYMLKHSENQEKTAKWLVENGADIIIGAHPHVVQDTASINNVPVVYSLGNAVSNMSAPNTQLELMATVKFVRQCNGDISMEPIELTWLWCSRPGGFNNGYTVVPIEEYIGRRDEWTGGWDYDKMMATYDEIRK